ncbi:FG-GAP-like repeat-containing protein [Clostridium tertium]|uniref:FG-GAP-like repeat-containing protein n=1 Tax=Clostridium tertium TaxID=1559 RepID=UPI001AE118EB|nr:FG-GAP-like repeat-containing protein [Clostridium tertium]MBP1869318.1 cell wall-associated NlpC family hydrolase [Clostridium tertium]
MIKKKLKTFLTVAVFTSIFSLGFLHSEEVKAYNAGGDGNVKFNSWDINNYSSTADLWTQTRANYDPERIKDRVTYGDYDGNGKDEVMAFYDYGNANTGIHRLYEDGGKYYNVSIYESGVNNFNASSITNKVVSGDFNGDGKDEILVLYDYFNRTSTMFQFSLNSDGKSVSSKTVWNATDFVGDMVNAMVAGDFNGDGKDEVLIFYDYGNNVTVVFELTMGSDGKFTSREAFRATQFAGSQIKGKTVSGDYDGNGKDEVAMFYDYGNATTRILSLINNNGAYSLSETWYSNSFNGSLINGKVVSTHNSSGKDKIIALYDYGNNVTGAFTFELQSNSKFAAKKEKELTNYESARVEGRLAVGKFDGQTTRLTAMYDGTVVNPESNNKQKVVNEALYWVGRIPYYMDSVISTQKLDKNNPPPYMDCADFTSSVYYTVMGIKIGTWTGTQKYYGNAVDISAAKGGNYSKLLPGDLIIFTWPGGDSTNGDHVAIYIGNGQIVHESGDNYNGGNVKVNSLNEYWSGYGVIRNNIISIRRVI